MANPYYKHQSAPQMPMNAPMPRWEDEYDRKRGVGPGAPGPGPASGGSGGMQSNGRPDPALDGRKLFIGGIAPTGIDADVIRYDFSRFGEVEDCFVPADRNEPGKIRGIAFVTYRDEATARLAIQEMHNRNYHGREITVNVAKPRGPDPKKDGTFHANTEKYGGKYDAGGRLRPEFRGTVHDPEWQASRGYVRMGADAATAPQARRARRRARRGCAAANCCDRRLTLAAAVFSRAPALQV